MEATKKLEWIKERIAEGRTVYLTTYLRSTKITAKHLPLLKATAKALYVRCGSRWIDYNGAKITAA
jgi:hypothetical protein